MLTYVLYLCCWLSLALSLLAPWLVRLLATPRFYRAEEVVPLLVFGGTAFIAFNVMSIGIGRAKKTQFNWVVTGAAALVNIGLNFALIPPYGMIGAAISTLVAYLVMFFGMTIRAQQVFPVPYQWRRIVAGRGRGGRANGAREGPSRPAVGCRPALRRLPAGPAPARVLPAGRAAAPPRARSVPCAASPAARPMAAQTVGSSKNAL